MPKWDVGDKVYIPKLGVVGTVLEVKKSCYTVEFRVKADLALLELIRQQMQIDYEEVYKSEEEDFMAHELLDYTPGINLLYD